ncbi:hypothetical protein BJX99DRAFT_265741 [Aspergillus californicus]
MYATQMLRDAHYEVIENELSPSDLERIAELLKKLNTTMDEICSLTPEELRKRNGAIIARRGDRDDEFTMPQADCKRAAEQWKKRKIGSGSYRTCWKRDYRDCYGVEPDRVLNIDYPPTIAALDQHAADLRDYGGADYYGLDDGYYDAFDDFICVLREHNYKAGWLEDPESPIAKAWAAFMEVRLEVIKDKVRLSDIL